MKTLLKIFLVLFVLVVVTIAAGLFVLTRPSVQKRLIESQLPEGSSIRTVRVTTSSLELSELKLALPDGTEVRLAALDADFKPMAALFDHTVKLGALNVDGLVVDISTSLIQSPTPPSPSVDLPNSTTKPAQKKSDVPAYPVTIPGEGSTGSPMDALYMLGQIDWLFDIDSIQLEGELRDASGSSYAMDLRSGAIRPGQEASIEASLKLNSSKALHAGLKNFDASMRVFLKQNIDGGFEQVRVESLTKASDQIGNNLLTISQNLALTLEGFDERASVDFEFNADLPRPEIFLPEMVGVGAMNVQGSLAASAVRDELTLSQADLLLSAGGAERVTVKLNKDFTIGGEKDLSGNLMDVRLSSLPLAWLAPWLPEGLTLAGHDLSAQFNLSGLAGGALQLSSTAPLRIGPLSLSQGGAPLLEQVVILAQPVIRLASDQSISWNLNEFQIQDRYGEIISGQSTGSFNPSASSDGILPAGIKTDTKLSIGLQEVTQQPALAQYASILSGQAMLDLKIDPSEKYLLQTQGRIDGISPRAYPGQRQDYRFALQVAEPKAGELAVGANLEAGSKSRPSSNLQFAGQVRPEAAPLDFEIDLTAQRLSQRDIDLLSASFEPQPSTSAPVTHRAPVSSPMPSSPIPATNRAPAPTAMANAPQSVWAGFNGQVDVTIAELFLLSGEVISDLKAKAVVTDPLLSLNQLEGSFNGGNLSGQGEARFSNNHRNAYTVLTRLNFENIDPSAFSKKSPDSFPVRGLFNGKAQFSGQGASLDEAVDAIQGELVLTGREGVLTAFKLDSRSSLGLIGAGLLGQQLNRPGLTAMARAVPYFENMPFTDFSLKLVRGSDRRIIIPELLFVGRNVLINGRGSIAATSLKEALSQPLDLTLELGAKGQLVDSLEILELLGPDTSEDGFRLWSKTISIVGSLDDPDTSALERVLKDAANRALTQSGKKNKDPAADAENATAPVEGEATEEQKPSKEEKILQDVETGLDILNSLLGG